MKTILIFLVVLTGSLTAHASKTIFVNDVEVVEYLVLKICLDEDFKLRAISIDENKTSYENKEIINELIEERTNEGKFSKNLDEQNCYDFKYYLVNRKYQHLELKQSDYHKCRRLKKGKYTYIRPCFSEDVKIKRRRKIQIERDGKYRSKYRLNWVSPCEYNMFYIKVPEYPRLEGQTLNVKIIDILENGDYVYRANFRGVVVSFGVMRKVK